MNPEIKLVCAADDDYFAKCGRNCIKMKTKEKLGRCIYLRLKVGNELYKL